MSVAEWKARTEAMRAAGTLPGAIGTTAEPTPKGARITYPVKVLCPQLGARLPGQPCSSRLHRCGVDGAIVTRVVPCIGAVRTCQDCTIRPDGL